MKSLLFLIILISISTISYSQKVKIKNDIAYVDGVASVKWKTKSLGNEMSVYALDSENEDIFISFQS